ncbi:hypothetical protein BCD64_26165 [Nostoc sp. MBR 210]|nr:hypothetical protein BCD64_26165 [Nostoc sp. MBR 210]
MDKIRRLQVSHFRELYKILKESLSEDKMLLLYTRHSHNLIKNLNFFLKSTAITFWNLADNIVEILLTRQFLLRNNVIKWQFAFKP